MTAKAANNRPTTLSLCEPRFGSDVPSDVPALALDEAVPEYLDYLHAVGRRSPATISAYRSDLSKFRTLLGDGRQYTLSDINAPLVERWMGAMRHLAPSTVRRRINALSSLFKWAVRFGRAQLNPCDQIERPRANRQIQPCPTSEEVSAMLEGCKGDTERACLLAMATSGLRRGELLALDWQDVGLENKCLLINGKGDKQREVLVFPQLLAYLYILHEAQGFPAEGPVFRGRQGGQLRLSTLQRWFNSWLAGAGLRNGHGNPYTLHSLRRFAAKTWLNNGLNIRHVQILLGHEDLRTTIQYLNYQFDEIQRSAIEVDFGLVLSEARMPGPTVN